MALTPAGIVGTLALAAVVLLFLRLGFWQLARLAEQREVNAGIAARLDAAPIDDAGALQDTSALFYRTITLTGTYDNERAIVLPGRARRGLPGVHVLTPLRLTDRADAVLVNRGWVPSPDAATIDLGAVALTGPVTLTGLVLPFPGRSESLGSRGAAADTGFRTVWFSIDEPALRRQYPYTLLPATVQELPATAAAGSTAPAASSPATAASPAAGTTRYPAALEPPQLDPGPHLGYALQWFAFALIGVIGWIALVLRSRGLPGARPPTVSTVLAALVCAAAAGTAALRPAPAHAQLRPAEPMDWRVFDDDVSLTARLGVGSLWDHQATLAGTAGRLLELGNYGLAFRSGMIAVDLSGTVLWRLREDSTLIAPLDGVSPSDGTRQEVGLARAATLVRLTPSHWPAAAALRFGATIPTSSDESGLERDRTDFFATVAMRYVRGPITLGMEHGVGINGTLWHEYPQSDVWLYNVGGAYDHGPASLEVRLVGSQDGHSWVVRGNEDQRELRAGVTFGHARWLGVQYIRGLADFSPAHGVRVTAGIRGRLPPFVGSERAGAPAAPATGDGARGPGSWR
jgi:surfeit locus 1 family protein